MQQQERQQDQCSTTQQVTAMVTTPPTLWVTFGIPGSGKTTWTQQHAWSTGATLLSNDPLRTAGTHPASQLTEMSNDLADTLAAGNSAVVDACNIHTALRRRWLRIGRAHNATCCLVVINTPHTESVRRNQQRPAPQRVSTTAMSDYIQRWTTALATAHKEQWDSIELVTQGTQSRW
jgi:predicted kinase